MKVNIHFHGSLAKKLKRDPGKDFVTLDVDNPTQMFFGLRSQVKGFDQALRSLKYGIKVVCLDEKNETAYGVAPDTLSMGFPSNTKSVHVVPCMKGSGIETAVAAFFVYLGASAAVAATLATITINIAVSLVLGAVARVLAPSPDTSGNGNENPEQRASFIYNGPVNTVQQGGVIPLVYGQTLTGSVVISAGVNVEDITT